MKIFNRNKDADSEKGRGGLFSKARDARRKKIEEYAAKKEKLAAEKAAEEKAMEDREPVDEAPAAPEAAKSKSADAAADEVPLKEEAPAVSASATDDDHVDTIQPPRLEEKPVAEEKPADEEENDDQHTMSTAETEDHTAADGEKRESPPADTPQTGFLCGCI